MIQFNVKNLTTVQSKLKSIKTQIAKVPEEAYKVFVQNTPIKTGNARRSTKLKGKQTIEANYPYAQRLDNGYSKQSRKGMTKPTTDFIRKRIRQITKGRP